MGFPALFLYGGLELIVDIVAGILETILSGNILAERLPGWKKNNKRKIRSKGVSKVEVSYGESSR